MLLSKYSKSNTPLLFLPGLLCDAALWQAQVDHLASDRSCQVADLTQDDNVSDMAAQVLSRAPERFALVGLSMGGYVAFEILRQAPERVERLALLDTRAQQDTDQEKRRRRGLITLSKKGRFRGVTPQLLPSLIHPDRLADEPLVNTVMEMARRIGQEAFVRQQEAILGRPDSRPDLPTIDCPCLVLCGRQDQLTPLEFHEEMASAIRNARLVVVDDCGHLSSLERPQAVTSALTNWLVA